MHNGKGPCPGKGHGPFHPEIIVLTLFGFQTGIPKTFHLIPRLGEEGIPILRRVPPFQHLLKHPIGIPATSMRSFGSRIIDPRVHDDPAFLMKSEEQPVLLEERGPEPMFAFSAQGSPLAVLGPIGILGDHLECQFEDRCEAFGGVLVTIGGRMSGPQGSDLLNKRFELIEK